MNAERNSGLLQRIVAEGHEVGNHTFSHPNIALISDRQLTLQLNATQRLFESRLGRSSVLFRPLRRGRGTRHSRRGQAPPFLPALSVTTPSAC